LVMGRALRLFTGRSVRVTRLGQVTASMVSVTSFP
jgi:hypothetical protein